jgi:hypothetical protein
VALKMLHQLFQKNISHLFGLREEFALPQEISSKVIVGEVFYKS